ncbi:MAG: pitrilysin family protein [Thermodesulfovibrionales bacterium]
MPVIAAIIFLILAVTPFPAAAAGVAEHSLPNGLEVFVVEDHKSPLAVFQIWYRVGARNEVSGRTGISHVLEHMMFKGTAKYGSKELSRTVGRFGGSDNAGTSRDFTFYHQILPSDKLEVSFRFESDRMKNLLLRDEDILAETRVVMEERRMRYEDDPESSLFENVVAMAFKVHPYHWPVIGWMPDLESIGPRDLRDYYEKYYCPNNAFIVVAGDVEPGEVFRLAGEYFGGLEPCPPAESFVTAEPPQDGERRVLLRKEAQLPYVEAAYRVPSIPHEDSFALDVLAGILSGGKSSRLYRSLVYEKKIALSAYAQYSGTQVDPYLFFLGGTAAPGREARELEEALYEEVEAIKKEPPTEFELEKAKNQVEASFVMGQDSIQFQAQVVGQFEILGDWRLKDRYLEGIRAVTARDIQRVADKYLTKENRTVGVLVPLGGGDGGS